MAATATAQRIDAEFRIGGQLFATAKGSHTDPVIRGASGGPLSEAEIAALGRIVGLTEDMFELVGHLVAPVGGLLGLGIAL